MNVFRRVPLSYIRVYEAASRTLYFADAARELNLSPSAVSHSVRKLEDLLGHKLFQRSSREVRLAPDLSKIPNRPSHRRTSRPHDDRRDVGGHFSLASARLALWARQHRSWASRRDVGSYFPLASASVALRASRHGVSLVSLDSARINSLQESSL